MSVPKSPVSILQEIVMSQHLPFPLYEIVVAEYGYRCTVVIGQLSANGFGISKKQAKQLSADRILKMLWSPRGNNGSQQLQLNEVANQRSNSNEDVPKNNNLHDNEEPHFNAVTKLNETCCKNGGIIPVFVMIEVNYTGYTIECRYHLENTRGRSYSKKQAKQIAAYQMIKRLEDCNYYPGLQRSDDDKARCLKRNTFNNLFCEEKRFQTKPFILDIFNNLNPEDKKIALNVNAFLREQNHSTTDTEKGLMKKLEK